MDLMENLKRLDDGKMCLHNCTSSPRQKSFDQRERMVKKRKRKLDKISNTNQSSTSIVLPISNTALIKMSSNYPKQRIRFLLAGRRSVVSLLILCICYVTFSSTSATEDQFRHLSNLSDKKKSNSLRLHSSSSSSSQQSSLPDTFPFPSLPTSSSSIEQTFISSNKKSRIGSELEQLSVLEKVASSLTFTRSEYDATIPENSLGRIYVTPTAESERMGILFANETIAKKMNVKFKIRNGDPDDFFKAESETVGDFVFLMIRIRTNNFDVLNRERKSEYTLDIISKIREKGSNKKKRLRSPQAKTVVKVKVTDTNDLDPFFQPSAYSFNVPEDTPLHTSFGRVVAEDADEGINGEIYYSIVHPTISSTDNGISTNKKVKRGEIDQNNIFAVDPVSGVLTLTCPLNFRDKSKHKLTIIAQDRGAKSAFTMRQADTATVDIHVQQVIMKYFEEV